MNRREHLQALGLGLAGLALGDLTRAAVDKPQLAITMDDFKWQAEIPQLTAAARNSAILNALRVQRNKAAFFVNGQNLEEETGRALLREWNEAGHIIGNHTYSHPHYPGAGFAKYTADILRNEQMLKPYSQFRKLFRFTYLKEGRTATQRDQMRVFLKKHGYRNAHVTIDASDWYIDQRLRERLAKNPQADTAAYRDFYLKHLWERARFYDDLTRQVLGHSIRHTLLVHHNILNGLYLQDALEMFRLQGWQLIDAADAYRDPIFKAAPNIAPAGESLIWALAKESGKFAKLLRYPGEDGDYEKDAMDKLGL